LFWLDSGAIFGYLLRIQNVRMNEVVWGELIMRDVWVALLSSASLLMVTVSASAQGTVPLNGFQLDGITLAYQYDPSRYPLRLVVEAVAVTEPDRMRDTLLTDDAEAMEAQQMPAEEPEERCTPARRALLAMAGSSESPADATTRQEPGLATSAAPPRESASTENSHRAASSRELIIIGGAASPAQTVSANAGGGQPVRNAGSSARPIITKSSQPAAVGNAGPSRQQVTLKNSRPVAMVNHRSSGRPDVSDSSWSPAPTSTGATGKRSPAASVTSGAPQIEVQIRAVRSDNPSRSSDTDSMRTGSATNGAAIAARVRSEVSRALSAVQGPAFRWR
jgi:hypothetical protein